MRGLLVHMFNDGCAHPESHALTHSPTRSLTHSLTHSLAHIHIANGAILTIDAITGNVVRNVSYNGTDLRPPFAAWHPRRKKIYTVG